LRLCVTPLPPPDFPNMDPNRQPRTESTEDETGKIKKVMLLLFGPEPAGFSSPSQKEPA